jgi:hypothetical protein
MDRRGCPARLCRSEPALVGWRRYQGTHPEHRIRAFLPAEYPGCRRQRTDRVIRSCQVDVLPALPSKDDLVLAVLALRDQNWFSEIVAEAQRRSATPEEELLVIFDVFADRLGDGGYKTNMLIKVLMEMGPDHPLGQASVTYLARIRGHVQAVAEDAGLEHSELFARAWHLLLKGSIISAMEGDQQAASLAKDMAGIIIGRHRRSLP